MTGKKIVRLASFALFCALLAFFFPRSTHFLGGTDIGLHLRGMSTISDRLRQYGPAARGRLRPYFTAAHLPYPPARLVMVGMKREKRLELYAGDAAGPLHFVRSYPILGASGHLGPKLREDDMQVPEGFYRIESLNPNSALHLALRVNYPNDFDHLHARQDGRTELGGNIMIHGSRASIGCLAMGDTVAEDLFVLAADTGLPNIKLLLCPVDFRVTALAPPAKPVWTAALYHELGQALRALPPRH